MRRQSIVTLIMVLVLSTTSVYVMNVNAATWITKSSLPQPLDTAGATVLSGKIYVIGGLSSMGFLDTNYEYDPLADSWTVRTPMPTKRASLTAASANNKIYAIGGCASVSGGTFSTNEEFDPVSNSWTVKAPMPTSRNWISAATVSNKIYVIGGSDNLGGIYSMNEVYDPLTDSWSSKTACPHPRLMYGVGVVNDKIYVIGGWDGANSISLNEEYDPQTDTWTTKAPMPTSRNTLAIAVLDNMIYAIGGATNANPWTNNLNVVEKYDPLTDTWTTAESLPTARSSLSAVTLGNLIYAIGGLGSTGFSEVNEAFPYTQPSVPVGGEWTPVGAAGLLTLCIGLVSAIAMATSLVGVKRIRRRQD